MSELRTHSLRHNTATGQANIQMHADGSTTIRNLQNLRRNVLINGAMQVSQYGARSNINESTAVALRYAGADRWKADINGANYSVGMNVIATAGTDSAGPLGEGFVACHQIANEVAVATPDSDGVLMLSQYLPGDCVQDFAKGTAAAKQYSLSFWAFTSVAGTYTVELFAFSATNTQISFEYNMPAGAWRKITHTFNADTSDSIANNTAAGLGVLFWLSKGSDFNGGSISADWRNSLAQNRAPNQVNWAAAANNTFRLTGVQLTATPAPVEFQFEDFRETIVKCQRYYFPARYDNAQTPLCAGQAWTNSVFIGVCHFPTTMLRKPDVTIAASSDVTMFVGGANQVCSTLNAQNLGHHCCEFTANTPGGFTQGHAAWLRIASGGNGLNSVLFSAEL